MRTNHNLSLKIPTSLALISKSQKPRHVWLIPEGQRWGETRFLLVAQVHTRQHFTPLKRFCPNCQQCVTNKALPENGSIDTFISVPPPALPGTGPRGDLAFSLPVGMLSVQFAWRQSLKPNFHSNFSLVASK